MQSIELMTECLSKVGVNVSSVGRLDPSYSVEQFGVAYQSAVVFASTGPQLWAAFEDYLRKHPSFLELQQHPLDLFLRNQVEQLEFQSMYQALFRLGDVNPWSSHQNADGEFFQWAQCSILNQQFVDFRLLAESAHLGHRSPLGILLHPKYGPWLGLRFALFTTLKLPETTLKQPSPCLSCDKPCISVCPAQAISGSGWDLHACYQFHRQSSQCHSSCDSRLACPVGSVYRYGEQALMYHHNKLQGRQKLARSLNIKSGNIDQAIDLMPWQRIDL